MFAFVYAMRPQTRSSNRAPPPVSMVEDDHQAPRRAIGCVRLRRTPWRLTRQRAIGYWIEGEEHELWIAVVV